MRWLRRFFTRLSTGFGLFKALNPVKPMQGLVRTIWTAGILRWFLQFLVFVVSLFWAAIRWFSALDWRLLLQGAPALLIGAAVVTFSIMAVFTRPQELVARYTDYARAAGKAKDYKMEVACYERLAQMKGDNNKEIVFDLAIACEKNGQLDRCVLLMQQLAPPDKPGYALAHLWYANFLITRSIDRLESRLLARSHLEWALKEVPDKDAVQVLLGQLCFAEDKLDEAERHLVIGIKSKPYARLLLAKVYRKKGDADSARREARTAATIYSEAAKADWSAHLARLQWAEAELFLENFDQAQEILQAGLVNTKEDIYRVNLASLYTYWFDSLERNSASDPAQRMRVLEVGLQLDPKNLGLLNRLLYATGIRSQTIRSPAQIASAIGWGAGADVARFASGIFMQQLAEVKGARDALRKRLSDGNGSAAMHFAVGIADWEDGDLAAAQNHWEIALKLAPNTAVLANNLAFLMYQTDTTQLQKALDLADIAVKNAPREPGYRDTRGRILLKMRKYQEAITELELALNSPNAPTRAAVHRELAEAYRNSGDARSAAEHTRLADDIERPKTKH